MCRCIVSWHQHIFISQIIFVPIPCANNLTGSVACTIGLFACRSRRNFVLQYVLLNYWFRFKTWQIWPQPIKNFCCILNCGNCSKSHLEKTRQLHSWFELPFAETLLYFCMIWFARGYSDSLVTAIIRYIWDLLYVCHFLLADGNTTLVA